MISGIWGASFLVRISEMGFHGLSVIFAEKEYFGKIRVKGIYFLEILNLVFVAEIDCIEIY